MSMLSRWTIGAMASKKARASLPVTSAMASARPGAVSGPVAMMVGPEAGRASTRSRTTSMLGWAAMRRRHLGGEAFAVDGQRRAGGHAMLVGRGHDQRTQRPHFLVEQADRIVLGIVGAEAVRADHLGQPVGLMRRRHVAAAAHLAEADLEPRFGQLPGRFGSGQSAADDVNLVRHARVR